MKHVWRRETREGVTKREATSPPTSSLSTSPTCSSRDKSPAGSPITALTAAPLCLRLHRSRRPSPSSRFRFPARLFLKKVPQVVEEPATSPPGVLLRPFFHPASQSTACLPFLVIPFRATRRVANGEKRVERPRGRLCPSRRKEDYKGWRKVVGRKERGKKPRAVKRAQRRKKEDEGKCNEGRPRRKWRNFPAAAVCYSFLLSPPTLSQPFPRAAALFMTLSTSLAAVFLRHYTWKNSAPGKLDIQPRVHAVSGKGHACPVYPRAEGAPSNSIRYRISDVQHAGGPERILRLLHCTYGHAKTNYDTLAANFVKVRGTVRTIRGNIKS